MDSPLSAEQSCHILLGFGSRKQGIKLVAEKTAEGQRFQPSGTGLAKYHAEKKIQYQGTFGHTSLNNTFSPGL